MCCQLIILPCIQTIALPAWHKDDQHLALLQTPSWL